MRRLKKLEHLTYIAKQAKQACYDMGRELEEKQCWYDSKPDVWKKSLHGRHWARMLFKAHLLVAEIEYSAIFGQRIKN